MFNWTRSTGLRLATVVTLVMLWSACSGSDDGDGDSNGVGGFSATNTGGSPPSVGGTDPGAGTGGAPVESTFPDTQAYVDAHNAVRAGVVEPPGYPGTWEPLPPVTWSDTVAQSAQEWADYLRDTQNCGLLHDTNSEYGENLAAGTSLNPQGAVDLWASEASDYAYSPSYVFDTDYGHYTQIVWRDSTQIGCASADCARSSVVVCRYSPPGNFIGNQPY